MGLDVCIYKCLSRISDENQGLIPGDDPVFDAGAIEIGYFRKWYAFVDRVFGSPTDFSYDAPEGPRNDAYIEMPEALIRDMIENPPAVQDSWRHVDNWLDEVAPACLAAIADGWHIYMTANW